VSAFHATPAVILAALAAPRLEIHLLPAGLSDVRDEQISRQAIKAEAPRVAQAQGPDLFACAPGITAHKGIIRRDVIGQSIVGVRVVHINAEHLAQQRRGPLRVVLRIAASAAISHADVEIAIGAKLQLAAVMVAERLRNDK
jgi:hypothetical protein